MDGKKCLALNLISLNSLPVDIDLFCNLQSDYMFYLTQKYIFVCWLNEFLQFLCQKTLDVFIDITKITLITHHNLQNLEGKSHFVHI